MRMRGPILPGGRRRGVAFLIELFVILVLLGAVGALACELFISSVQLLRRTAERETMITRLDAALDQLRRDAWSADSASPAGDTLQFHTAAGTITWQMQARSLVRIDPAGTRSWIDLPAFRFSAGPRGTPGSPASPDSSLGSWGTSFSISASSCEESGGMTRRTPRTTLPRPTTISRDCTAPPSGRLATIV